MPYFAALPVHFSNESVAIAVLVGCGFALLLWIILALRRSPYDFRQSLIYFVNVLLTRVLWRTEIVGRWTIKPGQGAVIVSNHRASVDPFFIQLLPGRPVHWFVAKEYFRIPLVGWFLRATLSIPTSRGGIDTKAIKVAIRSASDDELVGMLPEGRINDSPQLLLPGRPGAALVALKSRVPVVPCYIHGAPYDGSYWGCLFMPAKVRLIVGQPIDLTAYLGRKRNGELLKELTHLFLSEIATLAGQPEFEPQIAGKRWKPTPD